jgi:hypothetical protein
MEDEFYNEYEEDIEDEDDDIDEKDSGVDYEDYENNLEIPEDKIEDEEEKEEEIDSDKSSDTEDLEENIEDNYNDIINIDKNLLKYKKENIENFSPLGIISYLCNIVNYIKKGGTMLDTRTEFNYPDETEESYALECILLNKEPFEYIVNKKKININTKSKIMCLKIALRCVDENKSIFFTPTFVKKFPIFTKSLMNNYISEEELREIAEIKETE